MHLVLISIAKESGKLFKVCGYEFVASDFCVELELSGNNVEFIFKQFHYLACNHLLV